MLADLVNIFEFSFRDDLDRDALVRPINEFVAEWKSHRQPGTLVLDHKGGAGAGLYDSRFNRVREIRLLTPLEMLIYEFCDAPRRFDDIARMAAERHPGVTDAQVRVTLDSFVAERFMVTEADVWLSLALHDAEFVPWQVIALGDQWMLFKEGKVPRPW